MIGVIDGRERALGREQVRGDLGAPGLEGRGDEARRVLGVMADDGHTHGCPSIAGLLVWCQTIWHDHRCRSD
jgi:hypothetical protein